MNAPLQSFGRTVATGALALVCSGAMMFAAAGPVQAAPVANVRHADLNLATATGRATLDSRIDAAVRRVCARGMDRTDVIAFERQRECRRAARAAADERVAAIVARTQVAAAAE